MMATAAKAAATYGAPEVRRILMATTRDVPLGSSHPTTRGWPTGPGADLATRAGLVGASRATIIAELRCFGRRGTPRPSAKVGAHSLSGPDVPAPPAASAELSQGDVQALGSIGLEVGD
jgi:hypothetical protein